MRKIGFGLLGLGIMGSGCASILGLDDFQASSGAGGGTGAGTTTGSAGGSAASSSAGNGSSSTGTTMLCTPGETQMCPYMGAMGTENVGACKAGFRVCNVDGDGYGMCMGEVTPAAVDDCGTPGDENCDGTINDGCPCMAGTSEPCYSGPAGTQGVGPCVAGTHTCNADGMSFGACMNEVVPVPETCNTAIDDDCNGMTNEGGVGCVCVPDSTAPCYSGPAGTEGVGICAPGTKTCNSKGTAYLAGCAGEVVPAAEKCDVLGDEDCDGIKCSEPVYGESFQIGTADQLAVDGSGNTYLFGHFNGSLVFGGTTLNTAGSSDLFLAKLGPDGKPIWAKRFGDASNQNQANAIAVDSAGNVVIAASLIGTLNFGGNGLAASAGNSGFAVARFSGAGTHLWSKAFQSASNLYCRGLGTEMNGDVIMGGELQGAADFGTGTLTTAGSTDIFVARIGAAAGAGVWSKRFGDAGLQQLTNLTTDKDGNIALIGNHDGVWNFGGANLTANGTDMFVARLDPAGGAACSKTIDNGGAPSEVRTDTAGAMIVAGSYNAATNLGGGALPLGGASDLYLAKFSISCLHTWSKGFGAAGNDFNPSLAVDAANNVILGAQTTGTINFGGQNLTPAGATYDVTLAKLTTAGVHVWSRIYGTAGIDSGMLVGASPTNEVILAFSGTSNVDIGTGPLTGGLVVGKLSP